MIVKTGALSPYAKAKVLKALWNVSVLSSVVVPMQPSCLQRIPSNDSRKTNIFQREAVHLQRFDRPWRASFAITKALWGFS